MDQSEFSDEYQDWLDGSKGGGRRFFDRTLAAFQHRPRVIGVGFAAQAIRTIFPQPHDVPMDQIVTEAGTLMPANGTRQPA